MTKLLCWLRRHDWRESGVKLRTAPSGGKLQHPIPLVQKCDRCGKIKDVIAVECSRGRVDITFSDRGRSRVEKIGDGIVLAAILIVAAMVYAVAREYWG